MLALVDACTEDGTGGATKAPWRSRKEAYLAHLAGAALPVLLIVLADKLQSARELVEVLRWARRQDGEESAVEVWARFKAGRAATLWFHEALLERLRSRLAQLAPDPQQPLEIGCAVLLDDLTEVVETLARL